uniref:Uncharacterized protein n=1 Tax=Anguilla anguilla TaxID=7936 RepID=A0A0E9Q3M0_ANGAN
MPKEGCHFLCSALSHYSTHMTAYVIQINLLTVCLPSSLKATHLHHSNLSTVPNSNP